MDSDLALGLMKELLWTSLMIAGPVLAVTLITGLVISIFQVATQLQEMTLSYVPKLIFAGLTLVLLGSWMLHQLTGFAVEMIAMIPQLG